MHFGFCSESFFGTIPGLKVPWRISGNVDHPVVPRWFLPTCQVRVVRFYVSCRTSSSSHRPPSPRRRTSTTTIHAQCSLPDLNHDQPRPVFAAGPQPRPSTPSVRCRTSTTTIHAQCSLPDLNHDQPRPVFAAGPQPRHTTTINAQCSLPDLNHDHPRPVFASGPQPRPSTPSVRCRTSTPMPKAMPDKNGRWNAR